MEKGGTEDEERVRRRGDGVGYELTREEEEEGFFFPFTIVLEKLGKSGGV
jgi:hypothetical protein